MKKSSSTVSIHPSTKKSKKDDEFQTKTDSRIDLPLLQIVNGASQSCMDFSNFVIEDKDYGTYFSTYKKSKLKNIYSNCKEPLQRVES